MLAKHKNSIGMEYHDEDRYVFAKPPKKTSRCACCTYYYHEAIETSLRLYQGLVKPEGLVLLAPYS